MHDLPDESDSDDDFDGYLEPDDGPVAYRREENFEEPERRWSSSRRSRSLESLAETEQGPPLDTESPLVSLSPSYSPMQGHNASRSPLAATTLAPRYSGTATGASTGCTAAGSSSLSDTAGGSSLSHTAGGSSSHSRADATAGGSSSHSRADATSTAGGSSSHSRADATAGGSPSLSSQTHFSQV